MTSALLVIDVQKGLFEKTTPIYQAHQLLLNINSIISKARQAGVPVFFIQHSSEKILEMGSDAWKLHPDIQPAEGEIIIHKVHPNAFEGTNLLRELKERAIDKLIITGLVTHGCVKATCLGALEEGFRVRLVSDGHSSYSKDAPQLIEKWNTELNRKGAELFETINVSF